MKTDNGIELIQIGASPDTCMRCGKKLTETIGNICPMCSHIVEYHSSKRRSTEEELERVGLCRFDNTEEENAKVQLTTLALNQQYNLLEAYKALVKYEKKSDVYCCDGKAFKGKHDKECIIGKAQHFIEESS